MYRPGEKILVKNHEKDEWRQRWFVAFHPFNTKIVTSNKTQVLASWFKHKKLNQNQNGNQTNQTWQGREDGYDGGYFYTSSSGEVNTGSEG